MTTATAHTSTAATEKESATHKDTTPSAPSPSTSVQSVTLASDSPSITKFEVPGNLIPQCQNIPEGKKIYLCYWKGCGSSSTNIDAACTHIR